MKIHQQITAQTWRQGPPTLNKQKLDLTEWFVHVYPPPATREPWKKFCQGVGITMLGPWGSLAFWNDAPERTFGEIHAALVAADL